MNNLLVVGGGPVGLNIAARVADEGWSVDVLEEHPSIGKPVHCSGLISVSGCKDLHLDVSSVVLNKIMGARIYSPDNQFMEIKRKRAVANVVDRRAFDKLFYEKAKKAGATIHLNSKLMNIRGNSVFFQKKKRGEIKKSAVIVGADGVQSKTRSLMGIVPKKDLFVHAYQEHVTGDFDSSIVEVHLGAFAPGYFAWVIPKSSTEAEIGLGVRLGSMNPADAFKKFVAEKNLQFKTVSRDSAMIPCGPPLRKIVKDNMLLVGDAAFQTKATTGGGLIFGLQASNIVSRAILNNIKHKTPIANYNSPQLKQLNRELLMHWKIYSYYNSLSEKAVNKLFTRAKRAGVEDFLAEFGDMDRPSRFVGKVLSRPRLWGLMPHAMRILM